MNAAIDKNVHNLLNFIKEKNIAFVNLQFTGLTGKSHQITFPAHKVDATLLTKGAYFDGSSILGWQPIENSDLCLRPILNTHYKNHFSKHPTLTLLCDVYSPTSNAPYPLDPRYISQKAEAYLKDTSLADQAYFGPELEFFVFDGISYQTHTHKSTYTIHAQNGAGATHKTPDANTHNTHASGHTVSLKGGYFACPPHDTLADLRADICLQLDKINIQSELHHHEVGTAGQCEIGAKFATATRKADELQITKQTVHSVCHTYNKTATFMPKPLLGENGSGMHVHISLWHKGKNIFAAPNNQNNLGLSDQALHYIGGIIKHAKALNAFTNPTTNSYKRLIPGFEAPVILAYGANNRSAAIRIPATLNTEKAKRIELRFPDPLANPYLAFAAITMAGVDGIIHKIDPGTSAQENLYKTEGKQKTVAQTLTQALEALDADRDFLKVGGVFNDDLINAYIALKREEVKRIHEAPHPLEFEMYAS